jgi:hypothetical protein
MLSDDRGAVVLSPKRRAWSWKTEGLAAWLPMPVEWVPRAKEGGSEAGLLTLPVGVRELLHGDQSARASE